MKGSIVFIGKDKLLRKEFDIELVMFVVVVFVVWLVVLECWV